MTTMAPETEQPAGVAQCGCCGRTLPASRLTELGSTPGVFICAGCALWAARRSTAFPVVRLDPRLVVRWARGFASSRRGLATTAIPVLHSADLDRTTGYYEALGLEVAQRHDTYLVMQAGPVELHFTTSQDTPAPGQAFLHVPDAGRLWKQLQQRNLTGIGPVEDQASGLREFVVTDPDGNHIRVGSPTPKD
jgi:catechol 2,3-dioxygenase-like lactoylglutathione lyase family enzyme